MFVLAELCGPSLSQGTTFNDFIVGALVFLEFCFGIAIVLALLAGVVWPFVSSVELFIESPTPIPIRDINSSVSASAVIQSALENDFPVRFQILGIWHAINLTFGNYVLKNALW